MLVKAKQGTKCPKEGKPREYIDENGADVPASAYYNRLVRDGSLVSAEARKSGSSEVKKKDKEVSTNGK